VTFRPPPMRALAVILVVGLLQPVDVHAQRPAPVGARSVQIVATLRSVEVVPRRSSYPARNRRSGILKRAAVGAVIGAGLGALAGVYESFKNADCTSYVACVRPNNTIRYAAVGVGIGALIGGLDGLGADR
jgi:hypothetical protein